MDALCDRARADVGLGRTREPHVCHGERPPRAPPLGEVDSSAAGVRLQRPAEPEVGGWKRVALAEPERDVIRGPLADPRDRGHRSDQLLKADASIETDLVVGDRARKRTHGHRTDRRQAGTVEIGFGEPGRRRESRRQTELGQPADRRSEALDQPADERIRAPGRNLLTDDRQNADLERVPGAGHADAGTRTDQPADDAIAREMPRSLVDVEIEPRNPACALHDENELAVGSWTELERAGITANGDSTAICVQ